MSDDLLHQTNKRLTLNLLIQGAAVHTCLTAHHLVREELEALRPGLTRLYDRAAVCFHLNYWIGDIVFLYGFSWWFWRRTNRRRHPFHRHRLLATRGRELSRASKRYLLRRGWKKWAIGIPVIQWFQMCYLLLRMALVERRHRPQLAELAKRATSLIWGIDENRLDARWTTDVAFGHLNTPKTAVGRLTQGGAIGYGGVERRNGRFHVLARSWNFPLVAHELTKGVAELVCLHGLNTLDDRTYEAATEEADQIEYETWLMQAGSEMWRRFLAAIPADRSLAETLMHVARLDPRSLERLMLAVVDDPATASKLMPRELPDG
jgi:hypothetical protein